MKYTCAVCKQALENDEETWTEQDRVSEFEQLFGHEPQADDVLVICDDCFKLNITEGRIKEYKKRFGYI